MSDTSDRHNTRIGQWLNLPSCADIRDALTLHNIGHFFISPLFAALIFFFAGLYTNSVLQVVADRQVVHCGEEKCPPLPDLGHELFPHLTFVSICDYWLYAAVGMTLIRFSPLIVSKSLSLVMLRRWLFLQGTLFWFRGISVALTRQSVPQEDCVTTALGSPWIEGFYIMTGIHITCGDIMYSGHTAGISLCVLLWTHYSKGEEWRPCCGDQRPWITPNLDAVGDPATCSLTAIIAWVFAFGGFFFIIATHFHYSNDVFIGLIITQFVFRVYHYYIKSVLEMPGWWAKVFRWFEGFDVSLLEMTRTDKHARSVRYGLLKDYRAESHDSETYGRGDGRGLDGTKLVHPSANVDVGTAAVQADHNAGHLNRAQIVAPLAGVAVAVFSEGPDKAKRDQRDEKEAEHARRNKEAINSGSALKNNGGMGSRDNASAPRASGRGIGLGLQSPESPVAVCSSSELTSPAHDYHAMQDTPHAAPVVVAGEIAQQEQERKKEDKR